MGLQVLVDRARQLADGVWEASLSPREVQQLGSTRSTLGTRSVLLVQKGSYQKQSQEFRFDANDVTVLNLGTSSDTLVIASGQKNQLEAEVGSVAARSASPEIDYGRGDREFLQLVGQLLRGDAKRAAESILKAVRSIEPGDLQRGERHNFKNTPDNFWYVIVQPTKQSLSITVRGEPDRFRPSAFNLKADRPGYARFKLERPDQIEEALRIIQHSKRK